MSRGPRMSRPNATPGGHRANEIWRSRTLPSLSYLHIFCNIFLSVVILFLIVGSKSTNMRLSDQLWSRAITGTVLSTGYAIQHRRESMPVIRRMSAGAHLLTAALLSIGCQGEAPSGVILVTTTSTQDSGLLDALIPVFERQTGYQVKTIAIGTGQALATGARGEADIALTHAPELEEGYVKQGAFTNRRLLMHNDFVVAGPPGDPASLRDLDNAAGALARVAVTQSAFASRADNSGTHFLEKKLWEAAQTKPAGGWYIETGQGMGATLLVASEKSAYTLIDRGTFLAFKDKVALEIVVQGDPVLMNVYHVMEVDSSRFPKVNADGARALSGFLLSETAQAIIDTFGVSRFGSPLFTPDASPTDQ